MGKSKKFGAFEGVFLPSLLSILGVIMYMRLGWIVGQGGFFQSLIIILSANVISFLTGLSISSIATDKKVKAGGIYYILSRSLGLPMGGAIGISITLAMTFVISLNIVGFCESFLAIESVANFLHLEPGLNSYRIVGSIILIILFITNLISTKLAVKTQYLVFTAIVLSILSILLGVIFPSNPVPAFPSLHPVEGYPGFMVLFGIFFPAATGFTTGVAMSGELKDPKKAIPRGVLGGILTGIIVYIVMVYIFSFHMERNILLNSDSPIVDAGFLPFLVIAGIWGATLSTALGAVLAAPKTLQAIALDKIAPKIFTKTSGKTNEPRIAMIFIAIIAEAGILIGDLNMLAPIVTMFFMVSYAFINLAFFLEKWSSTDFRPSFKVNKYIGLIGFIICVVFMFQLNPLGMLIAVAVMMAIYYIIKKQNKRLEFGDVWQSVFLSITRGLLSKMNKRKLENRNWQPNIIVFSGEKEDRPYLLDFGKWLVGKHGFISNFKLTEKKDKTELFAPCKTYNDQLINDVENTNILEPKEYRCINIYDGIETLSTTYGFIGIEPNTILLGYTNNTYDTERFTLMLQNLSKVDKNILLMHFNTDTGFGNKKHIDIWITPGEQDSIFAINIIKMLWLNDNWNQSILRVNMISHNNNAHSFIYNKFDNLLQQTRIPGEIRIINNNINPKTMNELIATYSNDSDIVFMGMPDFINEPKKAFAEVQELTKAAVTIIFISASKEFKTIGNLDNINKEIFEKDLTNSQETLITNLETPKTPEAATYITSLQEELKTTHNESIIFKIDMINSLFIHTLDNINKVVQLDDKKVNTIAAARRHLISAINDIDKHFKELQSTKKEEFEEIFISIGEDYIKKINNITEQIPDPFIVLYEKEDAIVQANDNENQKRLREVIHKFYKNSIENNHELYSYKGKIKKFISFELSVMFNNIMQEVYNNIKEMCLNFYSNINIIISELSDANKKIDSDFEQNKDFIDDNLKQIDEKVKEINNKIKNMNNDISKKINNIEKDYLNNITKYLNTFAFNDITINKKRQAKNNNETLTDINTKFTELAEILPKLYNRNIINTEITEFKFRLHSDTFDIIQITNDYINNNIIAKHKAFEKEIKDKTTISKIDLDTYTSTDTNELYASLNDIFDRIVKQLQTLPNNISVIGNNELATFTVSESENITAYSFSVARLMDHILQQNYNKKVKEVFKNMERFCKDSLDKQKTIFTQISVIESYDNLIDDITKKIETEINILKEKANDVYAEIHSIFENIYDKIQLDLFLSNAASIKNTINIKTDEKQTGYNLLKQLSRLAKDNFTNFLYKKSESKIITSRMFERDSEEGKIRKYMSDLNNITMPHETDQLLPYSYRQLFLSVQHYNKDLWIGKNSEIEDFKVLYSQYKRLNAGAILIKGKIGSGKSFFSYHVAKILLPESAIYTIKSIVGGSTSVNKFERAFLHALESKSISLTKAISEKPKGSVFILENIEQWWHRNEGGDKIIKRIIELIKQFGGDYMFILNSNSIGYNTIKMTSDLASIVLGAITLTPFNAEEIGQIILRRHNAGSLKFILDNKYEANTHAWHYAKLFSAYYNISEGNIKTALNLWLSCIDKVNDTTIEIHTPRLPESIPWSLLTRRQIIFLAQFAIHNSMSYERIYSISDISTSEINNDINTLLKFGLLERISENIFGINTVLYPFIIRELNTLEII